jgi:hypothetical protein
MLEIILPFFLLCLETTPYQKFHSVSHLLGRIAGAWKVFCGTEISKLSGMVRM